METGAYQVRIMDQYFQIEAYLQTVKNNTCQAAFFNDLRSGKKELLSQLPIVDYSGVYDDSGVMIIQSSCLILLELQKIPSGELQGIRDELKNDPFILGIHKTADGQGLLAYVKTTWSATDMTLGNYAYAFKQYFKVMHHQASTYLVKAKMKYHASYDPDAYVAEKPWTWYNQNIQITHCARQMCKAVAKHALKSWDTLKANEKLPEQVKVYYTAMNCAKWGLPLEDGRSVLGKLDLIDKTINLEEKLTSGYRKALVDGLFGDNIRNISKNRDPDD